MEYICRLMAALLCLASFWLNLTRFLSPRHSSSFEDCFYYCLRGPTKQTISTLTITMVYDKCVRHLTIFLCAHVVQILQGIR